MLMPLRVTVNEDMRHFFPNKRRREGNVFINLYIYVCLLIYFVSRDLNEWTDISIDSVTKEMTDVSIGASPYREKNKI